MHLNKTYIAVIPARGGSKRLPRKNILELGGKPLIAWTIEAALACTYIDEVVVTTDDAEIADVARKYGASVPFLRPTELARDASSTIDTVRHTILYYATELRRKFDYAILLQPTSPLRGAQDIRQAIELRAQKDADAIISVCEAEHSPLWMNTLPSTLSMEGFLGDEVLNLRSQDLETYYRLNGAIYICKIDRLLTENTFYITDSIFAYPMSLERSVDIDTNLDFFTAKSILNLSSNDKNNKNEHIL